MQRNQLLKSQTRLNKTTTHSLRHPVASYSNHHQLQATVANNLSQLDNQTLAAVDPPIRSTTGFNLPPSICTRRLDGFCHGRNLLSTRIGPSPITGRRSAAAREDRRRRREAREEGGADLEFWRLGNHESSTCVTLNGSGIQLAVGPQPLRFRNHNFGLAHRIMVKRLATLPHDPLDQRPLVNRESLEIRQLCIHLEDRIVTSRVLLASGESSTTKHRILHASGPHPIPPPNDPKCVGKRVKVRRLSCRASMTFRVVRTNQYNQDLGLIHSTNGNHLESPNEGSSIDHQVTIHLHAQNITMFPTNETWRGTASVVQDLELLLQGRTFRANLIVFPMPEFDINLGMDWLAENQAIDDFQCRVVHLRPPGEEALDFVAARSMRKPRLISFLQARKLIDDGYPSFLASITATTAQDGPVRVDAQLANLWRVGSY
ncbi:hypothetical protein F511_34968 [Dorcoceras hygrometricum]|uniref:Uncharacterized protein n=1 Tax=Dorcoceras hygrometricum TaxID=472368 RepID=A0A2Z7A4D9_9LAMI|nr:hypothetical protein F511_34968 [Dorcoceras hygrometricum]